MKSKSIREIEIELARATAQREKARIALAAVRGRNNGAAARQNAFADWLEADNAVEKALAALAKAKGENRTP